MFNPTRDQVRLFFVELWEKYRAGQPLAGVETIALEVVLAHPEYHALLADRDGALARDWRPEGGQINPFLHLSMHLAIEEQLSIDRPTGIRDAFERLLAARGDRQAALHDAIECLGEMMWTAQKNKTPPDGAAYVECVRRRL